MPNYITFLDDLPERSLIHKDKENKLHWDGVSLRYGLDYYWLHYVLIYQQLTLRKVYLHIALMLACTIDRIFTEGIEGSFFTKIQAMKKLDSIKKSDS